MHEVRGLWKRTSVSLHNAGALATNYCTLSVVSVAVLLVLAADDVCRIGTRRDAIEVYHRQAEGQRSRFIASDFE